MADEEIWWGLIASGTEGKYCIEVHQSSTKVERWQILFEFPFIQMWMEIQGPDTVRELLGFFNKTCNSHSHQSMKLGHYFRRPVTIVKDEETASRYFIRVQGEDSYDERSDYLQVALFDQGTRDFLIALGKVVEDWEGY